MGNIISQRIFLILTVTFSLHCNAQNYKMLHCNVEIEKEKRVRVRERFRNRKKITQKSQKVLSNKRFTIFKMVY